MNRSLRTLIQLGGLLLTGAALLAADNTIRIIAVSDITKEGQGTRHATLASPVYYYPHTIGFSNTGPTIEGVTSPPRAKVEIALVKALASQGYIYYKLANKPPSIMLVFSWGCMAPKPWDLPDGGVHNDQNRQEMRVLVLGISGRESLRLWGTQMGQILAATTVPRLYLRISGIEFDPQSQEKYVTLWCTQVSTEVEGNVLTRVLPALIQAATPLVGTQTDRPSIVEEPLPAGN